ncbi:MAG: cupin domain-containing protein [Candidimonas sp.]|nr:cupin domain-containing protein [Candidimonas sp.]
MSTPDDVQRLIRQFDLIPHPEGGHYVETYRSAESIIRGPSNTPRSASTAIYYLLSAGAYSAWHRIASDEMWHFYCGHPLLVHVIGADGALTTHRLGNPLLSDDAQFQVLVPAHAWFSAELVDPQHYAFVGCTVAPGFEFAEFELGVEDAMHAQYPQHGDLIRRLVSRHR